MYKIGAEGAENFWGFRIILSENIAVLDQIVSDSDFSDSEKTPFFPYIVSVSSFSDSEKTP